MGPMTWWQIVLQYFGWWNWDREQNRMRIMRKKRVQVGVSTGCQWPTSGAVNSRPNAPLHLQGGAPAEPCNGESGCSTIGGKR